MFVDSAGTEGELLIQSDEPGRQNVDLGRGEKMELLSNLERECSERVKKKFSERKCERILWLVVLGTSKHLTK